MTRKEELLLKISDLFSKKGYERTSIRDISSHLGLTSAGLYHHFRSKQEMLFEIMNYPMEQALATLRQELPGIKDPEAKITLIVRAQIRFYAENPSQTRVVVDERETLEAKYAETIKKKEREYVGLIKQNVKQILQKNRYASVTAEVATFCLLGMLDRVVHWYNPKGKIPPDELASNITTIFLNGLKGRSA